MIEIVRLPDRSRARFTWLLPIVFTVGALLGSVWPGQGNQLFVIGAMAGVWACFLLPSGTDAVSWLVPTLLGGLPVLFLFGWLLDRLRADPWLWGVALVVVGGLSGYTLLQGYGDLEAAIEHHGSFLSYCVCALQLGNYGATLLLLVVAAGRGRKG